MARRAAPFIAAFLSMASPLFVRSLAASAPGRIPFKHLRYVSSRTPLYQLLELQDAPKIGRKLPSSGEEKSLVAFHPQPPQTTRPPGPLDPATTRGNILESCSDVTTCSSFPPANLVTVEQRHWSKEFCEIIEVARMVYEQQGEDCSEAMYKQAMIFELYRRGIPAVQERPLYVARNGFHVLTGRVDLEIASRFVLELKITDPSPRRIRKDRAQVQRYLRVYRQNQKQITQAAIVYFSKGNLRVASVNQC